MREMLSKIDKEIRNIDKISKIGIPIFLLLIIVTPYIFTREFGLFDLSKNGNIGSNIGGITAPFIGVLSALLIYISFKAQVKANRIQIEAIVSQIEKNKKDEDLKFIYFRLTELQSLNSDEFKKCLLSLNVILSNIDQLLTYGKKDSDYDKRIHSIIEERKVDLISVNRYLNIISIIEKKINEINNDIDPIQKDYIFSVLQFEYYSMSDLYFKNYILKIEKFKDAGIVHEDSELDRLSTLCDRVQKFVIK